MANYIIDSLNLSNDKHVFTLPYGDCATAASTVEKVVTVPNFALESGARIAVKFTNTNSATKPTLNVNRLGAKAIYYKNAAISKSYLIANIVYEFIYDATNDRWDLIGDVDDKYTGDITGVTAGSGLTGGGSSGSVTLSVGAGVGIAVEDDAVKAKLKSETALSSAAGTGKIYPVAVDVDGNLAVNVPWTDNNTLGQNIVGTSATATANGAVSENGVYLNHIEGTSTVKSTHKITGSGATKVTSDANGNITISSTDTVPTIPTKLPNPNALTIGGQSYDGSAAVIVTAKDLGITGALTFLGVSTSAITDGGTQTPTISGWDSTKNPVQTGSVVIYNNLEFVWSNSKWELLGQDGSYALNTISISAGAELTGGGTLADNITIAHATKLSSAYTSNNTTTSISGSGASATIKIPQLTVNTYGHVTAAADESVTITMPTIPTSLKNPNTVTITGGGTQGISYDGSAAKTLDFVGAGATTVSAADGVITITSTDTNTHNSHTINSGKKADGSTNIVGASSSGALVMGDSGVTSGEYGPTANATLTHSGTFVIPDIKVNEKGIVTSVTNRTMTLPADNNTTYTPEKLGFGYATCSTAAATTAKTASLTNYDLVKNGNVEVKFTYAVPASATLNINNKGATPIYYKGAAITANVIKAGDIATFVYDGKNYNLTSIDTLASHTHTVEHTPAGSNSSYTHTPAGTVTSSFSGTAASHSHTFTGTEASHSHGVTVAETALSVEHTPAGTVTVTPATGNKTTSAASTGSGHTAEVSTAAHTHSYTPVGQVSAPTFTGTAGTTTSISGTTKLNQITGVGSLPSWSVVAPTHTDNDINSQNLYYGKKVATKCLILDFGDKTDNPKPFADQFNWGAGSLPTKGEVTVASSTHSHGYTPAGTISAPTFTGTAATIAASTAKVTVSTPSHTHTVSGVVTGITSASFNGTKATFDLTHTHEASSTDTAITPAGTISSKSLTPAGSVSSTFAGTADTHSHTFTGTKATLTTSVPK